MSLFFKKHPHKRRGFSLVELLVSVGIVTVILSIIVLNQRSYTESTTISNLAENMSLSLSEAQAYGLAVKEISPGTDDFTAGYGISVSMLEQGDELGFILFTDRNDSEHYDGDWSCDTGPSSECLEKVEFPEGYHIESFCVLRTTGADQCGEVRRADISFHRPNVEARMAFFNSGGNPFTTPNLKGVRITMESPSGLTKSVVVYTTGQLSVQ